MGRQHPAHLLSGTRRTHAAQRRWAPVVVIGAVLIAAVVFLTLPGGSDHRTRTGAAAPGHGPVQAGQRAAAPATTSTTTRPPEPTTTTIPPGGLPVTTSAIDIDDTSRPLVRNGTVLADHRDLPTTVWAPSAAGRFPLVVFASGYNVGPSTYARFCTTLAAAGYVVAAPSFPLEDPSRGNGLSRADLPNEATDVSFVISTLEGGAEAAHLAPGQIAVAGHSDGADVALMMGYQAGKADPRVKAIVADAPDPMTGPLTASGPPLLLMQGSADDVVPYSSSQTVFGQVPAARWYLTLEGATHLPPIQGGTQWTPVLDGAVADFLNAMVAGRIPASSLDTALAASPLAHLQVAGGA